MYFPRGLFLPLTAPVPKVVITEAPPDSMSPSYAAASANNSASLQNHGRTGHKSRFSHAVGLNCSPRLPRQRPFHGS